MNLARALRRLERAVGDLPAARARMLEAAPGWPTSTMSGPGGASAPTSSTTERAALGHDRTLDDAKRLDTLGRLTATAIDQLADLIERWARPARPGVNSDAYDVADIWCVSCRKAGVVTPVETGRVGLCAWCRKFKAAHGQTPPAELIDARARGRRISQAMVAAAITKQREGTS